MADARYECWAPPLHALRPLHGSCSCGWGCVPLGRVAGCRIPGPRTFFGYCACGLQCLRPRFVPERQITWGTALQSQWANGKRLSVVRAAHCYRWGKLESIVDNFHIAVPCFGTVAQVYRWIRWLATEQRIADRKLALAERFHAAIISARWTLPPAARTWDRVRGRPRTWDEDGWE
jgi:hypothetical protein